MVNSYIPTKKRLEEIISRIDEITELIVYDNNELPKKVHKIHKKVQKEGIEEILIEGCDIDDE